MLSAPCESVPIAASILFESERVMSASKRAGIRGAGLSVLRRCLAECKPFHTSGALRGKEWHLSVPPSAGRLTNESDVTRLREDGLQTAHSPVGIAFVVYSYATPIAWVRTDGEVYNVRQRFSVTTSKHQGLVRTYLAGA